MALVDDLLARTSKGALQPAVLMLDDGSRFYGRACAALGTATGEVCFNTSLVGYFEVLSDPSYAGQIVTMTYPQIGNYGLARTDTQASAAPAAPSRPALRALVVHDMCHTPSSWRCEMSLPEYLREQGIVAIEGIDTRSLVRLLRDGGVQKGIASTEEFEPARLRELLDVAPALAGQNLAATVSCDAPFIYEPQGVPLTQHAHKSAAQLNFESRPRVVVYDCGVKRGILECLAELGYELEVVPWDTPAEDVLQQKPAGVFLSNGPGDPDAVSDTYTQVEKLLGKLPIFGICLGYQMICLAAGAQMEKLKFGHRGGNQPVMNLRTQRVEITAQNHGFGLIWSSLGTLVPELSGGYSEHPSDGDLRFWVRKHIAPVVHNERVGRIRLTHVNLNDGTPEGIQLLDMPAFCVQYHPEASPGPTDSRYLFQAFSRLMDGVEDYLDIDINKDRLAGVYHA